jgi:prevent-host-death family protein
MTRQYSIEQVQAELAAILSEVEKGQTVEILRSGQRVAIVMPNQDYERLSTSRPSFWEALKAFRRDFNIDEEGVDDNFWEDVRDRSPGREVNL